MKTSIIVLHLLCSLRTIAASFSVSSSVALDCRSTPAILNLSLPVRIASSQGPYWLLHYMFTRSLNVGNLQHEVNGPLCRTNLAWVNCTSTFSRRSPAEIFS
ncbi:hypothetical protein F5Y14DRAFT_436257 [Nemania sp. NC0429]|nr:hypothetical protein F5Y14DRAFT_436257 [Nemania sp. NC0429]